MVEKFDNDCTMRFYYNYQLVQVKTGIWAPYSDNVSNILHNSKQVTAPLF